MKLVGKRVCLDNPSVLQFFYPGYCLVSSADLLGCTGKMIILETEDVPVDTLVLKKLDIIDYIIVTEKDYEYSLDTAVSWRVLFGTTYTRNLEYPYNLEELKRAFILRKKVGPERFNRTLLLRTLVERPQTFTKTFFTYEEQYGFQRCADVVVSFLLTCIEKDTSRYTFSYRELVQSCQSILCKDFRVLFRRYISTPPTKLSFLFFLHDILGILK